ncbi:MAG TPA: type II toxin-antitoxin system VapC family toxin [Thermoanaerobaculia bacterium]|jgi:predicted nucleic acid-binding protein|nr:type II toxin-antitoxin system VapC family toxin [Thermoanaerobaculia bacterium]
MNTPAASPTTIAPPLYGVDTMLFIYHFERNERFGEPASALLAAVEQGRCRLVTSVISLMEVLVIPKRRGMTELCRRYRELFSSFPNLTVQPVDEEVAELAAGLRAAHAIRTPDALHLATALRNQATAFVTEDRRLPRLRELPVLTLRAAPTAP